MRTTRLKHIDTSFTLAGASLFCSIIVQRSFAQDVELCSEVVCWTIFPILFKLSACLDISSVAEFSFYSVIQPTLFDTSWVIAISLTISCLYRAENGIAEASPISTPLLVMLQKHLQYEDPESRVSFPSLLSPSIWGSTLCALVTTLALSKEDFYKSALSIFAVIPHLFVYIAFLPKNNLVSRQLPIIDDQQRVVSRLCCRVVVALAFAMGVQLTMFGFAKCQITHSLLIGGAKAMNWFFILQLRSHVWWCIAPAIETFSLIAACDPFTQSSGAYALLNVVASTLALAQVIHILPKQPKAKLGLWTFLLASLLPYLANLLAIRSTQTSIRQSFSSSYEHPIETIVNNAKASFQGLVQRQSQNYTAACDEYRRRYNMEPPFGFEDWYNFAAGHQSPIIDDFDTVYRSVSPFWKMSGTEILQTMDQAQANSESELWSCNYSSSHHKTRCSHPHRTNDRHIQLLFERLLGNLSVTLPDIRFLVNHLDEPRVMMPPQSHDHNKLEEKLLTLADMSQQPAWNAFTKHCTFERNGTSSLAKHVVETFALPFVTNLSLAMDVCQNQEYQALHGFLIHPTSFRLIEEPVPILSTGSLSTMGDILFPSPAYIEDEFQYSEANDVDWENKRNNLYWAGSTTGGFASDDRWRYYHRQRFVSLAQNLEQKRHVYLQEIEGVVNRVTSKFLNARLFDVAFTRVFQCTTQYCREQKAHFKIKPWADKSKALQSQLAFDIDGNGISGRYYQLLASRSTPLKQTLLHEWHDDRLVPWAHYVPISQSMEELPELVSYLTSSEIGQLKAKEIAELGRNWYSKAFREIDMSIYLYRLVLELARLQDPKRLGLNSEND